jgi:hypothetical protein
MHLFRLGAPGAARCPDQPDNGEVGSARRPNQWSRRAHLHGSRSTAGDPYRCWFTCTTTTVGTGASLSSSSRQEDVSAASPGCHSPVRQQSRCRSLPASVVRCPSILPPLPPQPELAASFPCLPPWPSLCPPPLKASAFRRAMGQRADGERRVCRFGARQSTIPIIRANLCFLLDSEQ